MAPSSRLLRAFEGAGPWRAWATAFATLAVTGALSGWTPWLGRFAALLAGYVMLHLALAATRRFLEGLPPGFLFVLVPALAAPAALASAAGLRAANDAAGLLNGDPRFDAGVAFFFALSIAAWTLLNAAAEHRRDAQAAAALEAEARERRYAQMKLDVLQAQIEPHFLYNTLANVQQLVRTDAGAADGMLENLIRYLKHAIPEMRSGRSTLGEELARTEAYLAIMRIRMGERLRYEVAVPAELHGISVPPLSVMTLVENAVKHGLEAKPEGGRLRISGERDDGRLTLRVSDDGLGFASDVGSGTGLANLRERIASLHGERARLELTHGVPNGVEATLVLPVG